MSSMAEQLVNDLNTKRGKAHELRNWQSVIRSRSGGVEQKTTTKLWFRNTTKSEPLPSAVEHEFYQFVTHRAYDLECECEQIERKLREMGGGQ